MSPEALSEILATSDLERRPSRPPDIEGQNQALAELLTTFAQSTDTTLQRLVEIAMSRCGAESAGLSVNEDQPGETPVFRWWATTGALAPLKNAFLPYQESPDLVVLARGQPQLIKRPERVFKKLENLVPVIEEALVAPFSYQGQPVGTLWVINHGGGRPFDAEDRRMLESLGLFAAVIWRARISSQQAKEGEAEIERLDAELRLEKNRLVSLLKDSPAFVAMLEGPELRFSYVNDAYAKLFGQRPIVGLSLMEALPEIAGQGYAEQIRRVMETGEQFTAHESSFMVRQQAGEPLKETFVSLVYQPAYSRDGSITGVMVHGSDVSDQVLARRALAEMNANLEVQVARRSEDLLFRNEELERFTYSVSHDMRAPLRAIVANAGMVLEEERDRVSPEGQYRLERLSKAATNMAQLVDDLLKFARLGRREVVRQRVNLGDLSRRVGEEMGLEAEGCSLTIGESGDLSTDCDPQMIGMVLQNLFENACKFRRLDVPAEVHLGVEERDGGRVFFVRDNGIGFDMAYVGKIFVPFERLHREEYGGTGIGLANVRRAIEHHGGRVWAEGTPDQGATFFFTLTQLRR